MTRLVYVVEDDYPWAQTILEMLQDEFGAAAELERIRTHGEFVRRFEEIALRQPLCILLDVILPWADIQLSQNPSAPGTFLKGGIQCWRKLKADPRTAKIPVLILSVYDRGEVQELPDEVPFVRKDRLDQMVTWVRDRFRA